MVLRLVFPTVVMMLTATVPSSCAFLMVRPSIICRVDTQMVRSPAEEHLEEMSDAWNKLREKERDIANTKDPAAAYELAKEMLETAIDFTQTKEKVEEEHEHKAHEALERVLDQEKVLEEFEREAHHDAADADEILNRYEKLNLPEDREKRRETTVSEISHRVDDYVLERLKEAKEAEMQARDAENKAKKELDELHMHEEDLKATLKELEDMKTQQTFVKNE